MRGEKGLREGWERKEGRDARQIAGGRVENEGWERMG